MTDLEKRAREFLIEAPNVFSPTKLAVEFRRVRREALEAEREAAVCALHVDEVTDGEGIENGCLLCEIEVLLEDRDKFLCHAHEAHNPECLGCMEERAEQAEARVKELVAHLRQGLDLHSLDYPEDWHAESRRLVHECEGEA